MPTTLRAEQIRLPQFTGGDVVSLAPDSVVLALQAGTVFDTNVHATAAIAWSKISKTGSSLADLIAGEVAVSTTGTVDDLDFGNVGLIRFTNATLTTLRGLKAGIAGQRVTIVSAGAGQVSLAHQDTGSVAANRLLNLATSGKTPLAAGSGTATYQYDATTARWRLVAHDQGASIDVAFNAGDFTAQTGTWTVAAVDVDEFTYHLAGRRLTVTFYLAETVTSSATNTLRILIPQGFVAAVKTVLQGSLGYDGAWFSGAMLVLVAGTTVLLYKPGFGTTDWAATDPVYAGGTFTFEVQ